MPLADFVNNPDAAAAQFAQDFVGRLLIARCSDCGGRSGRRLGIWRSGAMEDLRRQRRTLPGKGVSRGRPGRIAAGMFFRRHANQYRRR